MDFNGIEFRADNGALRVPLIKKCNTEVLTSGGENVIFNTMNIMSDRIENKYTGVGQPDDIFRHGKPLDNRQQMVLDALPGPGSRAAFSKDNVSMFDLSALTAKTGDEFAMFTRGSERLVIRGDKVSVNVTPLTKNELIERGIENEYVSAADLSAQGYKWSGHTHAGDELQHLYRSVGDVAVLERFDQPVSVIYNSVGEFLTFGKNLTYIGGQNEMRDT